MKRLAWLVLFLLSMPVAAEPYLAVQQGYACGACHFSPSGGGLRSAFGTVFAENVMPSIPVPALGRVWTGTLFGRLSLGADARGSWQRSGVPHAGDVTRDAIDQVRAYAALAIVPDRVDLYIDEALAPGNARELEGYLRIRDPASGLYMKGGQFYLPFGWRLQDNTAFVREVSGISMTSPDNGVEIGFEHPGWSAQLDYTRGVANVGAGSGHQVTAQLVWLRQDFRVGSAVAVTQSLAGNRRVGAVFAGVRTGSIAWLGEVDAIRDDGFPEGTRAMVAALGEADWRIARGHNVKVTTEFHDPDRSLAHDQKARYSVVYEWTPVPFVQLRAGFRRHAGIPQNDLDNRHVLFFELHGFM
jgi:hypothetical protein